MIGMRRILSSMWQAVNAPSFNKQGQLSVVAFASFFKLLSWTHARQAASMACRNLARRLISGPSKCIESIN